MAKLKDEEASAPFWLLTMGDMNNLLMVFFIMLVSFMTMDKAKYRQLEGTLEQIRGTAKIGQNSAGRDITGDTEAMAAFQAFQKQPAAETTILRPKGHYARAQRTDEGTVLTLGGQEDAFDEGSWRLKPDVMEALVELKKWMRGRNNVIEIRGHTAANLQDSVVVEPDGRFRPFAQEDLQREDRQSAANHSMLSYLRAQEVMRFFLSDHAELGDAVKFEEVQLRIRAESYSRTVADSSVKVQRVHNRRIEVLLTSEQKKEK
jgi:flagellar motor protein MotB